MFWIKLCSCKACCSRNPDCGIGVGPRNGDSETSEEEPFGCCPGYRRRVSPGAGERGPVEDEDAPSNSSRATASL